MKIIGDAIYIQRGETWSLDFEVTDELGRPYMLFEGWQNPYLAITVTAARYEQLGDFRETYWLDLSSIRRFVATEPLFLPEGFKVRDILSYYKDEITVDTIKNYLFYADLYNDGNYEYKYIDGEFDYDGEGEVDETTVNWIDYNFRIVKQFNTKNWMEQGYLFDAKILAGESIEERIKRLLNIESIDNSIQTLINQIQDEVERELVQEVFDEGMPLMPDYDTKLLILEPTQLYVSTNIQGGVR